MLPKIPLQASEGFELKIIRSSRKTLSLEVKPDCVIVRAPIEARDRDIRQFVRRNRDWIAEHIGLVRQEQAEKEKKRLPEEELERLKNEARKYIPERVAHYAELVGVTYGRITVRSQHTRWGSCSSKGNLNFNCLLMLAPPEVLDSVVVHELCHLREMNHSADFYNEIYRVFPDYDRCAKWLKQNGPELMKLIK